MPYLDVFDVLLVLRLWDDGSGHGDPVRGLQESDSFDDNDIDEVEAISFPKTFQICVCVGLVAFCLTLSLTFLGQRRVSPIATTNSQTQTNVDPDERRKYISRILVVKHVIRISSDGKDDTNSKIISYQQQRSFDEMSKSDGTNTNNTTTHHKIDDDLEKQRTQQRQQRFRRLKSNLYLPDATDDMDSKEDSSEKNFLCAICLNEYQEGEEICWSRNCKCYHVFHHECIEEWLLRHDECPCCRSIYLAKSEGDNNSKKDLEEANLDATSALYQNTALAIDPNQ